MRTAGNWVKVIALLWKREKGKGTEFARKKRKIFKNVGNVRMRAEVANRKQKTWQRDDGTYVSRVHRRSISRRKKEHRVNK